MGHPAFSLAFFQGAFQDRAIQIIGNRDVARHNQKFQKQLLLGQNILHRYRPWPGSQNPIEQLSLWVIEVI